MGVNPIPAPVRERPEVPSSTGPPVANTFPDTPDDWVIVVPWSNDKLVVLAIETNCLLE